jgi:hypothetical protein
MISVKVPVFKYLFAFAFIASVPLTAIAAPVVYDCTFDEKKTRGGWIPPEVYVVYDAETGLVEVFDAYIKHFVGAPVKGKVTAETAQRIGFKWIVPTKDARSQHTEMQYRLTYYKDGRPAQMSALPGGYDNSFSGVGACKISTS